MQAVIAELLAERQEAEELAARLPHGSPEQADAQVRARRLGALYDELTATGLTLTAEAAHALFDGLRGKATT